MNDNVKNVKHYILYLRGREGRCLPITFVPGEVSEICEYLGISEDLFYQFAFCETYVIDGGMRISGGDRVSYRYPCVYKGLLKDNATIILSRDEFRVIIKALFNGICAFDDDFELCEQLFERYNKLYKSYYGREYDE